LAGDHSVGRRATQGETLAPAVVELREGLDITRLLATRLATEFGTDNHLRVLRGFNGVEVERRIAGAPAQHTTSAEFSVLFGPGGEWTEARQSGSVRFRDGERSAEAGRAGMVRATDVLTLEERAAVGDAQMRTTASKIEINQRTGEATARGNVRSTYKTRGAGGASGAPTNFSTENAHISAEQLLAGRESGLAVYSGGARLWQGDAVIEGDRIELNRDARSLEATGKVRGVFPEAVFVPSVSNTSALAKPSVVRFAAERLTYRSAEGKARLEGGVAAESADARLSAREMTLEFAASNASSVATQGSVGRQEVVRAVAEGGCTVWHGARHGAAERCTYEARDGKFILSGGEPMISDPGFGTTTGRQLTFFLADDKILVESDKGLRTVTRHRVEK